ncbi:hypothetical protein ES703_40976 [subsurface metagenome]|jgi:hypothetical protein
MMMVALACLLAGAVFGLRFRVYVLVLALAVAVIAIGVPALIEHGGLTAAWRVGVGLMSLQVGYLAGMVTRFLIPATLTPSPSSAFFQRFSRRRPIRQDMPRAL